MTLTDFEDIETLSESVYDQVPAPYDMQNVKERYPEIFNWISLFDTNIALIVMIMIIVGGINMITALLVLILERTQMIGLLGVLGMQQWSTQKVFFIQCWLSDWNWVVLGEFIGSWPPFHPTPNSLDYPRSHILLRHNSTNYV